MFPLRATGERKPEIFASCPKRMFDRAARVSRVR